MRKVILSVIMAGILLVGMMGTAFANPVTWDLDSSGNGTEASPYVMNHEGAGKTESGSVAITNGNTYYWVSDMPCGSNTTFVYDNSEHEWTLGIHTNGNDPTGCTITLGTWSGGTFSTSEMNLNPQSTNWNATDDAARFYFEQGADTNILISAGQRIAVRVVSNGDYTFNTPDTGENSFLEYRFTENPEWPVPEIATIIMIALGVMALGGYVWMRRRQPAQVVA